MNRLFDEEAVAVSRRLLGDLGASDRPVPHERRAAVERSWRRGESLYRRPEPARPADDFFVPQPAQQRVVLHRQWDTLPDVLTEPRIDLSRVAAPQHQVDPAVGQVLQGRELLGDAHRIVRGDQRCRGGQDQPLRARGDPAEHRGRR
jgi:hypothetical protein